MLLRDKEKCVFRRHVRKGMVCGRERMRKCGYSECASRSKNPYLTGIFY